MAEDERAYVVLMRVHLFFPESGSLKGKRAELNRVKALLRERLHTSVAEVGHHLRDAERLAANIGFGWDHVGVRRNAHPKAFERPARVAGGGPTNTTPALAQASANSAFSERNP